MGHSSSYVAILSHNKSALLGKTRVLSFKKNFSRGCARLDIKHLGEGTYSQEQGDDAGL